MHSARLTLIAGLVVVAHAHFQLQFPVPRGVFVMDNEVNFCGQRVSQVCIATCTDDMLCRWLRQRCQ